MKTLITPYFEKELKNLEKRYKKVREDVDFFFKYEDLHEGIHLWENVWKCRIGNSSIPTGKRWGFRIIVKELDEYMIPISLYAKTIRENMDSTEIENALMAVLDHLEKE